MKLWKLAISFGAGFLVATVIGLTAVVPVLQDQWEMKVGSDYCAPLRSIHSEIEVTAAEEGAFRTRAQLQALNNQFTSFTVGGTTPHDWEPAIQAAGKSATKPAGPASRPSP
ncbi:hypothetical protein [Humisphaera borealis]|uniref:Uncharacterized protein n=1 Tax=Humisphaera borealis TaxID=2807512 RepID=A0A7M2X3W8_9BACT|nr:hypothetical protein [Humisphaera borealis]QOV92142.1 hypothetical protein IPV69_12615 [Humisphaera borealis]